MTLLWHPLWFAWRLYVLIVLAHLHRLGWR